MTREELQRIIDSEPYDFLRTDPHLGKHLMFLTIGGSHAYGTNVAGSDVDIRECRFELQRGSTRVG